MGKKKQLFLNSRKKLHILNKLLYMDRWFTNYDDKRVS